MAGRGDHRKDNQQLDNLNRLRSEAGRLQLQMRNHVECLSSEVLLLDQLSEEPSVVETGTTETLNLTSEDDRFLNRERWNHCSLSNRILSDTISQCQNPEERLLYCTDYLKQLKNIEAELVKQMEEMCNQNYQSFANIINSYKLNIA